MAGMPLLGLVDGKEETASKEGIPPEQQNFAEIAILQQLKASVDARLRLALARRELLDAESAVRQHSGAELHGGFDAALQRLIVATTAVPVDSDTSADSITDSIAHALADTISDTRTNTAAHIRGWRLQGRDRERADGLHRRLLH